MAEEADKEADSAGEVSPESLRSPRANHSSGSPVTIGVVFDAIVQYDQAMPKAMVNRVIAAGMQYRVPEEDLGTTDFDPHTVRSLCGWTTHLNSPSATNAYAAHGYAGVGAWRVHGQRQVRRDDPAVLEEPRGGQGGAGALQTTN